LTSDELLTFLNQFTDGAKQTTRRIRYSLLSAFFNFIGSTIDQKLKNPCNTSIFRKLFRQAELPRWSIIEKEVVDEIIFRTIKPRNRLLLELMARGGMRIGEVLKLRPQDVEDRKLILRHTKAGREREVVFIRRNGLIASKSVSEKGKLRWTSGSSPSLIQQQ
jgi:integrase/recombinase XerD